MLPHTNSNDLLPHLQGRWEQSGRRTSGSWEEVFGAGLKTDEIFMVWHDARYVERVAAALLGHSSLTTTRIYVQPTAEQLAGRLEDMDLNAYGG